MSQPHMAAIARWQPAELVESLRAPGVNAFCGAVAADWLLLIRLDPFNRDLAAGLADRAETYRAARKEKSTLGLEIGNGEELTASYTMSRGSIPWSAAPSNRPEQLLGTLLKAECFMVPLRSPPKGTLSLGRAPSCDLVLRHPSVSKLHALLHFVPGLRLQDAGSLNQSFVNGTRIEHATALHDGDGLKLGAVEAQLYSPASLWAAVHGVTR